MPNLIQQLINEGILKTPHIIRAFEKVNRADFMLKEFKAEAEGNYPLPIGYGQTISQPLTVAFMLELLQPKKGDKILDIGFGSGWTTALLAEIVSSFGEVYAIERIEELKDFGESNVNKYFERLKSKPLIKFFCQDGSRGLKKYAPFDKILVSAAASIIPDELLEQLKIGGRLVIPVGVSSQAITMAERISQEEYKEKKHPGFVFVPLVQN